MEISNELIFSYDIKSKDAIVDGDQFSITLVFIIIIAIYEVLDLLCLR